MEFNFLYHIFFIFNLTHLTNNIIFEYKFYSNICVYVYVSAEVIIGLLSARLI